MHAGDTEVVTPLPALQPGPVSVRWRLVGADGHPITGRVDFTVEAAVATTIVAADGHRLCQPASQLDAALDVACDGSAASRRRW